jgi:hypothetical protein
MRIEDFRPTKADIELLLVSPEAAPLAVSELMRPRARDEWRVPDMPAVRNGKGEESTDRQWIDNWGMGDEYAWRVVLTPKGLELLTEALIRENAAQVYDLQIQVGRRELNEHDYTVFRVDRALSALKALDSPRYQELVKAWETELVKAEREGKEFTWEDAIGEEYGEQCKKTEGLKCEHGAQSESSKAERDSELPFSEEL